MVISRSDLGRRKPAFAPWRMLVWLLLIFAAYSGLQYVHLGQQAWRALQALPAGDAQDASVIHGMLVWYIGGLLATFAVVVVCAGCILRQQWARPVLRVIALMLCVFAIYHGVVLWHDWQTLDPSSVDLRRILSVGVGLCAVAIPLLLWLAWQLGHPAVRLQFRARRA